MAFMFFDCNKYTAVLTMLHILHSFHFWGAINLVIFLSNCGSKLSIMNILRFLDSRGTLVTLARLLAPLSPAHRACMLASSVRRLLKIESVTVSEIQE